MSPPVNFSDPNFDIGIGCYAYINGVGNNFHYIPSLGAGIAFLVLFSISMVIHTGQSIYTRSWWYLVFPLGCLGEILGWSARTWAHVCPYNSTAFLMQISTLIIAPTFFTAGIYVILGRFIQLIGDQYSALSARNYLIIFCTCDFLSLVIQAIGGAMASSADPGQTGPGTNTMVAGIAFQMLTISIFVFLFANFLWRARRVAIPRPIKVLTIATVLSVTFIYIRSIYRLIELGEGWNGYLISNEPYFIVLDGVMMVLAVGIYNIFHPAFLLRDVHINKEDVELGKKGVDVPPPPPTAA